MDTESLIAELGKIKRSNDQEKMAKLKFILDEILAKV